MKIAICDDQMIFHDELKKYLEEYAVKRHLVFVYDDYTKGYDLIASKIEYDLIFMDHQMDEISGLDTSRKLRGMNVQTPIIFLTSFPNIVFDTFEVNAYRFLVKPIDMEKLCSAMDDFIKSTADSNFLLIKTEDDTKKINIDNIVYIEASDKYCYIRTTTDNILYKKTLSDIEKQLPEDKFFRSHRTYLVGFKHIVSHTATDIIFDNKEKALISKMKHTAFKKAFIDYIKGHNF